MTRPAALLVSCVACVALVSCESKPPTSPSTTATVTSLALSAPPAASPMKGGDTHQFTAIATLSNGQTATTGFTVTWTSSDTNVLTVSATGLVTAKADGTARISAEVNTPSASIAAGVVLVVRGGRTLRGIVTEREPNTFVAIAGARVGVLTAGYTGREVFTNAAGEFSIPDVNGVLRLRIHAVHYDGLQMTADAAAADVVVARMTPLVPRVIDRADWRTSSGDPVERHQSSLTFTLRRDGPVDLYATASASSGSSASVCSELRDDDNRLLWSASADYEAGTHTTIWLEPGRRYELKVSDCLPTGRGTLYATTLIALHP